ncbi:MAG: SEC-C metal-binding domain-containing protein, partial [Egibacteraceae bacterium]
LLACTISPTFVTAAEAEAVLALDHVDWHSLIVQLAGTGAGAAADPATLLERIEEVAPSPIGPARRKVVQEALRVIAPAWQAIGVVDAEARLTDAGAWLLPRGACQAWATDFDDPESVDGPGTWEVPIEDEPRELDPDEQALVDAAVAALASAGAMSLADLALAVRRATDREVGRGVLGDIVGGVADLMPLRDGRLIHLPTAMDGVVLTHRLSEVEVQLGALLVHPDLVASVWLPGDLPLAGGGTVGVRYRRGHPMDVHDALVGPLGWLHGLAVGDLVAVRATDGVVSVSGVDEDDLDLDAAARTAERLAEVHDRLGGTNAVGGPIDGPELLLEALARTPLTLATPQPPLGALLTQAGLDLDDGIDDPASLASWVDGLDALTNGDWPEDDLVVEEYDELLLDIYDLDEDGLGAHHLLMGVVDRIEADGVEALAESELDAVGATLADAAVAESIADMATRRSSRALAALRALAVAVHGRSRGRSRGGAAFLRARTAEHLGLTEEAEAMLGEALGADPDSAPALLDAAWYAEDRGEAARAVSLLRRAGVGGDDPQLARLRRWAAPAPAGKVGRNDPCPCGSGRKYKVCCQRRGGRPLGERAGWLLDKAGMYAHRPMNRALLLPVIEARAGDPQDPERLVAAMGDPLVQDLGLFEEGLLADFLDDRGVLLPADELELGRSWLGTSRGLYEIVDVRRDEGLTLLDLRSGDRLDVVERIGTHSARTGEAVLARLLPVAGHHILAAGGVRVPVQHREQLLAFLDTDPTGPAIAAWVAALEAPPRLVTTEGEATVFCQATYEVADVDAARRALDARYAAHGEDAWSEPVDTPTGTWTRGTLHLDGERLVVQTNAVARLERFKRTIAEIVPAVSLVDEERRPMEELGPLAPDAAGPALPVPDDPADAAELAAALDTMIRTYEDRWLDESIPLLDGLTPRQAAEDPTRREQLRALLDEMDAEPPPGLARAMDAQRLRERLGL